VSLASMMSYQSGGDLIIIGPNAASGKAIPMVSSRAGILFAVLISAANAGAQEIVTLPSREGVSQSFLLIVPKESKPAAVAILFPGGPGSIRLRTENGEIKFGPGNFLVRAVAVMDAPSDESRGMDDRFRLGDKHAADVKAVVADLKKRFENVPVFLVGTSRGSISAAAAGSALGDNIAGIVLTSTVYLGARSGPGLSGFDFAKISAPVLLVHPLRRHAFSRSAETCGRAPLRAGFRQRRTAGDFGCVRTFQPARLSWQGKRNRRSHRALDAQKTLSRQYRLKFIEPRTVQFHRPYGATCAITST
jgi:pimeloyl-ACP methyl ester carboxylesterase